MKNLIGIFFLIILSSSALKAQNWTGIGNGMDYAVESFYYDSSNNVLLIGGGFKLWDDSLNMIGAGIAAYDGDSLSPLGCGFDWNCVGNWGPGAIPQGPFAMIEYDGEIIAGGAFLKADNKPIKKVARWNGVTWDSLGSGFNSTVMALHVYDGYLYAGGAFDSTGQLVVNGLAKWNGSYWSDVGNFPNYEQSNNTVRAIMYYEGELYVGGKFHDSLNNPMNIARYDGNIWKSVGNGLIGSSVTIYDMEIFQGDLYVAGNFKKSSGNPDNNIARWDGEQWHEVGGGVGGIGNGASQIYDLHIYNDKLFAAGIFSFAGGVPAQRIAKWDGQQWCGLGGVFDNNARSIGVYNNELYIGGGFWTIDGDTMNHIAKWVGGDYVDTCGTIIGVEELTENEVVVIYPNPAYSQLTIELAVGSMQSAVNIYNVVGVEVYKAQAQSSKLQIDVSGFAEGVYLIRVETQDGAVSKKFVKQNE